MATVLVKSFESPQLLKYAAHLFEIRFGELAPTTCYNLKGICPSVWDIWRSKVLTHTHTQPPPPHTHKHTWRTFLKTHLDSPPHSKKKNSENEVERYLLASINQTVGQELFHHNISQSVSTILEYFTHHDVAGFYHPWFAVCIFWL